MSVCTDIPPVPMSSVFTGLGGVEGALVLMFMLGRATSDASFEFVFESAPIPLGKLGTSLVTGAGAVTVSVPVTVTAFDAAGTPDAVGKGTGRGTGRGVGRVTGV